MTRAIRPVTIVCLALMAQTCSGEAPERTAIPEGDLAPFRCGETHRLRGERIDLAGSLDAAVMNARPVILPAAEARWLLDAGWREKNDTEEPGAGVSAQEKRATIRLPSFPCDGGPAPIPPVYLRVGTASREGVAPPSRTSIWVGAEDSRIDRARVGAAMPTALLSLGPAAIPANRVIGVASDPPAWTSLREIALPVGEASIEMDDEYRRAIVASSVRDATFEIIPPEGAILRVGTAVAGPPIADGSSGQESGWTFRIVVATGREPAEELFRRRVRSDTSSVGQWHDARIDLGRFAGSVITLTLSAEPDGAAPPLALWGAPVIASSSPSPRPNILLISVDTLRADRIGRVSNGVPLTPHLEDLAREGFHFTACRSQAPSTLFGHASMLTGLPPSGHGISLSVSLPVTAPYLPALLAESGYTTVALTDDGLFDGRYGFARGFDRFRDRFEPIEEKLDTALGVLEDLPEPWFLLLHTYEVHAPYDPSAETASALTDGYSGPLAGTIDAINTNRVISRINHDRIQTDDSDIDYVEALYDADVAIADEALGGFFDALRSEPFWSNTIIVVTSDHGEEFDEHGVVAWHALTCYEELMRVPLIIKPHESLRGVEGGETIDTAVRSLDIPATLLDLAGVPVPETLWGWPLTDLMTGSNEPDRETLCEVDDGRGAALLAGGWKYHMRTAASVDDPGIFPRRLRTHGRYGAEELYDLSADPHERNDLLMSDPDRARALRETLEARLEAARALFASFFAEGPPPPRPQVDDEHTKRLRALGYVE